MKTYNLTLRKTALAAAVVLLVGGVSTMNDPILSGTGYGWMSSAYAAEDGSGKGSGGKQGAMGEGRGGQGAKGAGGAGYRGGKSVKDVLADDDDGDSDSDRPDWAGVPGGEGRPGGGGNPSPGDTKGDTYGDMILLVRNPVTGLPIESVDGWTYACTDVACTPELAVEMVDGEVPEGTTTFEVDLGRGSLVRMPSSVIERRLDEALGLIASADPDGISQDEAGRIVVTVDGVVKTIDSPLENLALYIDLMKGLVSGDSDTLDALGGLATYETAASLLAGMADKTGDISLDYLMYENLIAGIEVDFKEVDFEYERTSSDYTFWYSPDGEEQPEEKTIDLMQYLVLTNGDLPDGSAALFAAAADDAVEVVELIHTQIVTDELLPDGIVFK